MPKITNYTRFFEKNVKSLLKMKRERKREKLAFYLKLYSAFMRAEYLLGSQKGFDNLRIAQLMTSQNSFPEESHYMAYLKMISLKVIRHRKKIIRILRKDPVADPMHSKSQLLMAQNICVMRMLKATK